MKLRHYLSLGAAALILIGSFLLPNAVAGITDMRRIDTLVLIDSQRISFDTAPELALTERVALAANSNTEILPLNTGNRLNNETAGEAAAREVARFFQGGAFVLDYENLVVGEGLPSLVIDIQYPTRYMIIWEFDITDYSGNSVTAIIDDETSIIVRLIYRMANRYGSLLENGGFGSPDDLFFTAVRKLSEMMAAYYGVSVVLADYQFSGILSYYRADIAEGGTIIPTYGVVRSTSFTMNERV